MGRIRGVAIREKKRRTTPEIKSSVSKPKDWDKAVSAAYLRMMNETQETAAKAVGAGYRTLQAWEGSDWWDTAVTEARQRWLRGGDRLAMQSIAADMAKLQDAVTARWWADRRIPELAPPKQGVIVGGDKNNPVEVEVNVRDAVSRRIDSLVAGLEAERLAGGSK